MRIESRTSPLLLAANYFPSHVMYYYVKKMLFADQLTHFTTERRGPPNFFFVVKRYIELIISSAAC